MSRTNNSTVFYETYKTILNMLGNRGYEKPPLMPYDEFKNISRDALTIRTKKPKNDEGVENVENAEGGEEKIVVYFPNDEKIGIKPIRIYKNEMDEDEIKNAIIVVRAAITPFAKQEILTLTKSSDFCMEIFTEEQLSFDVVQHTLVPKHELLSLKDRKELLDKYKIKETQLPRILKEDPISRYYGFKTGEIIKITRSSETSGTYVYYRLVC